jgi:hypothetical protein
MNNALLIAGRRRHQAAARHAPLPSKSRAFFGITFTKLA